jgi:glycosyltransferase involved in cell wall biosynthesis
MKNRTILVSAYACEPLKGSEQGVGWNWVMQMAKNNYIHVITRSNNKEFIELHLPQSVVHNITFHYYDTHPIIKKLKNKAKGLYFYYFFWQLGITPVIRTIIEKKNIDYSMHLTMGSIWMPTFLPFFKIPFIWGPLGGGECVPKPFVNDFPIKQRIVQRVRYWLNATSFLNPFIVYPSKKAVAIIARTKNTAEVIPSKYQSKTQVMLETAMESEVFRYEKKNQFKNKELTKLIITGRLVPFKNVICAIRAMTYLEPDYNIHLTIIGSGPEKERIENEIGKRNLNEKVSFISEMKRSGVLNELRNSDIYLFPSLREGGTWALMEAMAIRLPVICLNWTGMEIITDSKTAIHIPITTPKQMPKDLADAIRKLIDQPELKESIGDAASNRIKEVFNWDSKGVFMENLFKDLDKK